MVAFTGTISLAETMTAAHLFFALMTTGYILIVIRLEEHDLLFEHGGSYAECRKQVPMLVPRLGGRSSGAGTQSA